MFFNLEELHRVSQYIPRNFNAKLWWQWNYCGAILAALAEIPFATVAEQWKQQSGMTFVAAWPATATAAAVTAATMRTVGNGNKSYEQYALYLQSSQHTHWASKCRYICTCHTSIIQCCCWWWCWWWADTSTVGDTTRTSCVGCQRVGKGRRREMGKGWGLPLPSATEGSLSFCLCLCVCLCAGVVLSITNQFCTGFSNCWLHWRVRSSSTRGVTRCKSDSPWFHSHPFVALRDY